MDNGEYVSMTFEEALEKSYSLYIQEGPRSPEKLKPLHGWFAEALKNRLDTQRYIVQDLNSPGGEAQLEGRYFPRRVDIAILAALTSGKVMRRPIVAISIRFIGSNFKQNANNYFENLLGECANLRRKRIGFAHFLVLPLSLPYKDRSGEIKRYEENVPSSISFPLPASPPPPHPTASKPPLNPHDAATSLRSPPPLPSTYTTIPTDPASYAICTHLLNIHPIRSRFISINRPIVV